MCILTNLQFRCFSVPFCARQKRESKVWQRREPRRAAKREIPLLPHSLILRGPLMWKLFEAFPFQHFLPLFRTFRSHTLGSERTRLKCKCIIAFFQKIEMKCGGRRRWRWSLEGERRRIIEKAEAESTNSSSSHFQFSSRARRASVLIRFDPCVGARTAPAAAAWIAKQRQLKMKTQGWVGAMDLMGFAELNGKMLSGCLNVCVGVSLKHINFFHRIGRKVRLCDKEFLIFHHLNWRFCSMENYFAALPLNNINETNTDGNCYRWLQMSHKRICSNNCEFS